MSITTPPPGPSNGQEPTPEGVRTYRGASLADLIPQVRAELGPDAIILREREGLIGGVNGFFAKRCVEVDARRAARIDVYDDVDDEISTPAGESALQHSRHAASESRHTAETETEDATLAQDFAETEAVGPDEHVFTDGPSFADHLEAATVEPEIESLKPAPVAAGPVTQQAIPQPDPEPAATPVTDVPHVAAPVTPRPPAKKAAPRRARRALALPGQRAKRPEPSFDPGAGAEIAGELIGQGVSAAEAARLVSEAAAHCSPFAAQGGLREAVRRALASRIPRPTATPAGGAAVAFVGAGGAGKTRCTAALATAYDSASTLSATALSLGGSDRGRTLKDLLKPERIGLKSTAGANKTAHQITDNRSGAMIVVDTAAATPGDRAAVLALSAELDSLALDAIYVTVPATLGAQAARQLLEGLGPLAPTGIVITHADETDQIGVAIELAWASGIPIAYVHEGLELAVAMSAPDPVEISRHLLP